ncbi:hypothetical protein [Nocardia asteroides]|uniref:hypothetical protein n=1 Tax=Nocardia asteroides TaxID=1824 RepID=UPI001E3201F5|nr:hypothetical protein [Nocardia asteroides]UGT57195.1 hypothetical protein LTT85_10270 [Nocardia asteroides]
MTVVFAEVGAEPVEPPSPVHPATAAAATTISALIRTTFFMTSSIPCRRADRAFC